MITEPGPIKYLADNKSSPILESIKNRVDISLNKHGSKHIAIIGHYDCAGNPVDNNTQRHQIHDAIRTLQTWYNDVKIIGLWVDENWTVHQL
jgi:carbonic anhydrase